MDLEGMLQTVVKMSPEAIKQIEHLERLLVGLAPIVARRSHGNVFALLGAAPESELELPERLEFVLQESGFFTVMCLCKEPLDESVVPRAMEVALTLNAGVPRGAFIVKGCSWLYRCDLFLHGEDGRLRQHLRETMSYATTCFGIFHKMLEEHVAAYPSETSMDPSNADSDEDYQDPLLRELYGNRDP